MRLKQILIDSNKMSDITFANKVYANLCNLVWYDYINDEVIKSYSKDNVELLILNIIESVKLYPRQYLFINNKDYYYLLTILVKIHLRGK